MAQPSVRFGTNPQPTYNVYEYSSIINPNIVETSGIRGTYEVPQASSYIPSPTTKITFNQPGGASKVNANTIGYTPPPAQTSQVYANAANPQAVNVSRTEVKERPAEVRTSNVQQAGAPSYMSNNYGGGRITYAVSGDRPIDDKWPKWVWPLVALLGFLLLTFGLLWGLGVFGDTKAKSVDKVAAAPKTIKESTPTITSPTTTPKTGSTTTKVSPTTATTASPTTVSSTTTSPPPSSSPSSIPAQTFSPVQVGTASTATPTTKTTVTTTTQPAPSTTTQPTYQPNYANSIPAIPASIAPMTSSTTPTQPTTTVTTQTVQPSTTKLGATTEPTSTTTVTTQPSSTTTATTQPSNTMQPTSITPGSTQPTKTTVTTTTTTKTA